jgi:hypothetical protein
MMPIDRRMMMLSVGAIADARQIIKNDLKRRNCKPSHYAQAEISKMALQYLQAGHWPVLRQQAFDKTCLRR